MYRAWAAFFFAAISSRFFASFSSCLWASSVKASAGMPSWVGAWIGRSWVLVSIARSSFSSDFRLGLVWLLDGGTLVGVGEAEAAAFDFDCCDSHLQVLWLLRADSEAAAAAALDLDCCDSHLQVLWLLRADSEAAAVAALY